VGVFTRCEAVASRPPPGLRSLSSGGASRRPDGKPTPDQVRGRLCPFQGEVQELHERVPYSPSNSAVERYRSAKDGRMTTIFLPAISGRAPTCSAADTAAPEEIPPGIPS